jgi:hypothetical protein
MTPPRPRHLARAARLLVLPAALATVAATLSPAHAISSPEARTSMMFVVRSPVISEDSALAHWRSLFVTTNDSGDTGRVFTLGRAGRTVGVTRWAKHPRDCEALAPAGPGHVWVGDIGDNFLRRSTISVSKVPVGRGHRKVHVAKYRLAYPDGAHNAETLVRDPRTGQLYVASKDPAGGTLYAVPKRLSRKHVNHLRPVAPMLALATDGAFFPGGRYLVIRNYSRAAVYDWPKMSRVGSFRLPRQHQGEGLTTGPGGVVYLSGEGTSQPVLRLRLPPWLRHTITSGSS